MKRILWFAAIPGAAALTVVLLQSALADSAVYSIVDKGTLSPAQANTGFGDYAEERCTLGKTKIEKIIVKACVIDGVAQYCHKCLGEDTATPTQLLNYMAAAASSGSQSVTPIGVNGDNEDFRLTDKGTFSTAQFQGYFSVFVTAKCTLPLANISLIGLEKREDGDYDFRCVGVSTADADAVHTLRVAADSDPNQTVEYVGKVVE